MQQKRVQATNDNLGPQVGDYVHVRNRQLARYIVAHLGAHIRIAEVRDEIVLLVAAEDYQLGMIIPRTVPEVLSSGLSSFGLHKTDVTLVGPQKTQLLHDIYQSPGITRLNQAD
jgi:hypothetical protein